ncbi:hypothetical protein CS542_03180 [Pedobacter sp. IW39]|nr:hypothetical protein CS542_03180 [Pedobacter sp. IW39]
MKLYWAPKNSKGQRPKMREIIESLSNDLQILPLNPSRSTKTRRRKVQRDQNDLVSETLANIYIE